MPTEKRLRRDYEPRELAQARVFVARKFHECGWHPHNPAVTAALRAIDPSAHPADIAPTERYIRVSETRVAICQRCAGFEDADIVTITREGK